MNTSIFRHLRVVHARIHIRPGIPDQRERFLACGGAHEAPSQIRKVRIVGDAKAPDRHSLGITGAS